MVQSMSLCLNSKKGSCLMSVLFLAEINDGQLAEDASAKAFSAARSLGDVTLLCIGADVSSAAEQASKLEGASKVLYCNDDDLDMIWQSQRQTSLPPHVLCILLPLRPLQQKYPAACRRPSRRYDHSRCDGYWWRRCL